MGEGEIWVWMWSLKGQDQLTPAAGTNNEIHWAKKASWDREITHQPANKGERRHESAGGSPLPVCYDCRIEEVDRDRLPCRLVADWLRLDLETTSVAWGGVGWEGKKERRQTWLVAGSHLHLHVSGSEGVSYPPPFISSPIYSEMGLPNTANLPPCKYPLVGWWVQQSLMNELLHYLFLYYNV